MPENEVFDQDEQSVDPENLDAAEPDLSPEELQEMVDTLAELGDGFEIDLSGDDPSAFTVAEALELLQKIDRLNMKPSRVQWSVRNGHYAITGQTTDRLPPGFYETTLVNNELVFMPVANRTDRLLRFPHIPLDKIIDEVTAFWERESRFEDFELPHKRGILLHGPPGGGKTCALQLVARDVVERGGIVLIYNPALFGPAYRQIRRVQPDVPIVVMMEDLDAILDHAESQTLNFLDGGEQLRKVVFIATTNYPERLGPRVVNRPSRFDKRIRVGHPDTVGRKMYLEFLLEKDPSALSEDDVERYVRDTKGMSMAHLKELFVATVLIGSPYDESLEHLTEMNMEKPTSLRDDDDTPREYKPQGYA